MEDLKSKLLDCELRLSALEDKSVRRKGEINRLKSRVDESSSILGEIREI